MSQTQLGKALGMEDQSTAAPRISRYETGRHAPDQQTLAQIAEVLGLPVAYFHATSDALAKIILTVSKLTPTEQEAVSNQLSEWVSKE